MQDYYMRWMLDAIARTETSTIPKAVEKQQQRRNEEKKKKNIRISHTFGTYGLTVATWFIQFEYVRDEGAETIAAVNCARRRSSSSSREKKSEETKMHIQFFSFFSRSGRFFFVSHALFSQISFLFHFRLSTLIPIRCTKPSCTSTVCALCLLKFVQFYFVFSFSPLWVLFRFERSVYQHLGTISLSVTFSRTHWSSLTPDERNIYSKFYVSSTLRRSFSVCFFFSFVFLPKILITLPSMVW